MEQKVWDMAIVGSGPAGLTAAIYAVRGGASVVVLAGEKWGGQLMSTTLVENFPGFAEGIQGPDLMLAMRKQAERLGVAVLEKNVTQVDFKQKPFSLVSGDEKFLSRVVVIAAGASTLWLDVPGEQELIGRGVSSCAPCDAFFFKDKKVAVVGGGDSAMEEALVLAKFASEVTIIHRRDAFRASQAMQEKVLANPKIKVIWNTEVVKVNGKEKVESLTLKNNQTNQESDLVIEGVFVAVGHKPESDLFKDLIEMDERGYVTCQQINHFTTATNIPGVFVSGDVFDKQYKQAITAAGSGCMAAMDALVYLDNQEAVGQNDSHV